MLALSGSTLALPGAAFAAGGYSGSVSYSTDDETVRETVTIEGVDVKDLGQFNVHEIQDADLLERCDPNNNRDVWAEETRVLFLDIAEPLSPGSTFTVRLREDVRVAGHEEDEGCIGFDAWFVNGDDYWSSSERDEISAIYYRNGQLLVAGRMLSTEDLQSECFELREIEPGTIEITCRVPEWASTFSLSADSGRSIVSFARVDIRGTAGAPADTNPPGNVVVNTDAKNTPGDQRDDVNWVIPLAIILGAAVVGGGAVALARGRKKDQPQQPQPQQQPSSFRMVLWKDCGDTLYWGGPEQLVGARIEEVPPVGPAFDRPDLTALITFGVSENLDARDVGMVGANHCVAVRVVPPPGADAPQVPGTAVVAVTFSGAGGSFTNNVTFKVDEAQIAFADIALTFVAGAGQTFEMPFKFLPETIAQAQNGAVRFQVDYTEDRARERFGRPQVVRDTRAGSPLYYVQMTERGRVEEDKDAIAGEIETMACEVVATIPPAAPGGRAVELRGTFPLFRYHEGVRLVVEPLKCYVVKHVETAAERERLELSDEAIKTQSSVMAQALGMAGGAAAGMGGGKVVADALYAAREQGREVLVTVDEALDLAARMQAGAIGMAGMVGPGQARKAIEQSVQESLRETARTAEEMFPEFYGEDAVYVLDRRDRVRLTPARTHAYVTLYVTEELIDEDGNMVLRPVTRLPKVGDTMFSFTDVPGSSAVVDKDGREVAHPADELDFRYFISGLNHLDNAVTFDILPTRTIMVPPNRSLVDVGVTVKWKGRMFSASTRVQAVSQPFRVDYEQRKDEYARIDKKRTENLRKIQDLILKGYQGTMVKRSGKTIGEFAFDLVDDLTPENDLSLIAVDAVEKMAGKRLRTLEEKPAVYCDDLMPVYHYIQSALDGYAPEFGYYDPDYLRIVGTFDKFRKGELGSAEAIDLAFHGHDMEYADAVAEVVRGFGKSWEVTAVRIACGMLSGGQTEWLFVPLSSIQAGMEATVDYIDSGKTGDDLLTVFAIGAGAKGAEELAYAGAFALGGYLLGQAGRWLLGVKNAGVLGKEAAQAKGMFQQVKDMFTSSAYGRRLAAETGKMSARLKGIEKAALGKVGAFRTTAQAGPRAARHAAYKFGRELGAKKVAELQRLVDGAKMGWREERAIVLAVQSDKHAMRALMELPDTAANRALRAAFSERMIDIEDKAVLMTRRAIAERVGLDMNKIRRVGTSGNAAADVKLGKKVSMDLDVTFKYVDEAAGISYDIPADVAQEIYNQQFYRVCKGFYAENPEIAREFTALADQTVTDLFHPEAYSPLYDDVMPIIDKSRAGEALVHDEVVAKVAKFKCEHWLKLGQKAAAEAETAWAAGDVKLAEVLFARSEAFAEEGVRQFTKQADRLVVNRIIAMNAKGVPARTSVNVDAFLEKVAVLKRSGTGYFGGTGLTNAEADAVLWEAYGCTFEDVFRDLETLTLELNESIRAAERTATTARHARVL